MYTPNFNFYTIWSNIAFYAILSLYLIFRDKLPHEILYAFIINMILVGIMGNIIIAFKIKDITNEFGSSIETFKEILLINLFLHTVPLVIAFIILQCMPARDINYLYVVVIIALFLLIWCVVPDNGKIFKQKIDANYGNPGAGYYLLFPLILILICLFTKYNKMLCSI